MRRQVLPARFASKLSTATPISPACGPATGSAVNVSPSPSWASMVSTRNPDVAYPTSTLRLAVKVLGSVVTVAVWVAKRPWLLPKRIMPTSSGRPAHGTIGQHAHAGALARRADQIDGLHRVLRGHGLATLEREIGGGGGLILEAEVDIRGAIVDHQGHHAARQIETHVGGGDAIDATGLGETHP